MMHFVVCFPLIQPRIQIFTNFLEKEDLMNIFGQYVQVSENIDSASKNTISILKASEKVHIFYKRFSRQLKNKVAAIHCLQALVQHILEPYEGCCCLHGFAVANDRGEAKVFVGATHSGKSTLGAFLINHDNLTYVADDVIMINTQNGTLLPVLRPIHLREEGWQIIKTRYNTQLLGDIENIYGEIRYFPLKRAEKLQSFNLKNIYFILRNDSGVNQEIQLAEQECMIRLIKNSYLPSCLEQNVQGCTHLIHLNVKMSELQYSDMHFVSARINL